MDAHNRPHLAPLRGDLRIPELAGASAFADPFGGGLGLPIGSGHPDVATESDNVSKAELAEEAEQRLVADAAIGQDRCPPIERQRFSQTAQAEILKVVAPGCDFFFPDRQLY